MIRSFDFKSWATPVKSRPWAVAAVLTDWVKRASRYHLAIRAHHQAWEHAVGVR